MAYTVPSLPPVQSGLPSSTPPAGNGGTLQTVMGILNSPAGAALIQAGGAGLSSYGQNKQTEANRAQTAAQFAAQMQEQQLESDRTNTLAKATAANTAAPFGADQGFAQRNLLLNQILPGLRNSSYASSDPAVKSGNGGGGLQLPSGGLDPGLINRLFGEDATLNSLQQHAAQVGHIDPASQTPNYFPMFGDKGAAASNTLADTNRTNLAADQDNEARQRQVIMNAIDNDIRNENPAPPPDGYEYDEKTGQLKKKGSSLLGKIGKGALKVGKFAIPIALAATGVGIPAAIAASGGLNALDTKVNGGSWKDSLISGGIGAATGAIPGGAGIGGGLKAVANTGLKTGLTTAAKSAIKNPAIYSAILGR